MVAVNVMQTFSMVNSGTGRARRGSAVALFRPQTALASEDLRFGTGAIASEVSYLGLSFPAWDTSAGYTPPLGRPRLGD